MIVLSFCFLCTSVNSSESEFVDQWVTVLLSCQARAAMVAFCLGTICCILFVLDLAIKGGFPFLFVRMVPQAYVLLS